MTSSLTLTSVFEFIADAGYIAYNEDFDHLAAAATGPAKTRESRLIKYKWQENKIALKYHLLKSKALHKYLYPRLSAKD